MTYLGKYEKHSQFAAAFAEQQMIDREAGRLELAVFCQHQADMHASKARCYRDMFVAYFSGRYGARAAQA